jgi:hypothetical protein
MIFSPRIITLDIGHRSIDRRPTAEPLCIDEMLSLIGEFADLGVERMRFLLHDVKAIDDLERLIQYARRRRCAVTVVCRTHADAASIVAIAEVEPDAIAIPLHSHTADVHHAVGSEIEWSQSIHLATTVHETGTPLEIETSILRTNALPLMPLSEVVESLHAASWHLDFSNARLSDALATSAATALIHIAASGRIRISVHELPFLRQIVLQHAAGLPAATPPLVATTSAAEAMHVTWAGDVRTTEADIFAGNIRLQALAVIFDRTGTFGAPLLAKPWATDAAGRAGYGS